MDPLKDQIQVALDESRILVLGLQILIGFGYRSVLETGFDKLPTSIQYLKLGSHTLMLAAMALLMFPAAYHQIVENGENRPGLLTIATRVTGMALLPFAAALGIDLFIATQAIIPILPAAAVSLAATLAALVLWYGLALVHRARNNEHSSQQETRTMQQSGEQTTIKDKVNHVLTETRVVLPGAQALLGFQLVAVLVDGFAKLPEGSRYVHLGSMLAVALSTMLLMAPAAYHRIAEDGQNTEHFARFAGRMLIAAMAVLALGLAGDFYVITEKIVGSVGLAAVISLVMLLCFYGLWFGFTLSQRGEVSGKRSDVGSRKSEVS